MKAILSGYVFLQFAAVSKILTCTFVGSIFMVRQCNTSISIIMKTIMNSMPYQIVVWYYSLSMLSIWDYQTRKDDLLCILANSNSPLFMYRGSYKFVDKWCWSCSICVRKSTHKGAEYVLFCWMYVHTFSTFPQHCVQPGITQSSTVEAAGKGWFALTFTYSSSPTS